MTVKVIFQAVLSILAGAAFIAVGIYFLSSRFLKKLNEASNSNNTEGNSFRAKGSGYTSIALGAVTLMQALLIFTFPTAASLLSLVYLFFILAAVIILVYIFKQKKVFSKGLDWKISEKFEISLKRGKIKFINYYNFWGI